METEDRTETGSDTTSLSTICWAWSRPIGIGIPRSRSWWLPYFLTNQAKLTRPHRSSRMTGGDLDKPEACPTRRTTIGIYESGYSSDSLDVRWPGNLGPEP